jgi:5-methylcytosine-specific restriction endonuclease McrA
MSKEKPNEVQRFVRGFIRDLITSTHKPKPQKIAVQSIHQPTKENKPKRNITLKVRMQVLKRDSLKCVYCGRKSPEVSLEVDHIIPFSKGGSNHISNLQTLCFDCNRGKSNRF